MRQRANTHYGEDIYAGRSRAVPPVSLRTTRTIGSPRTARTGGADRRLQGDRVLPGTRRGGLRATTIEGQRRQAGEHRLGGGLWRRHLGLHGLPIGQQRFRPSDVIAMGGVSVAGDALDCLPDARPHIALVRHGRPLSGSFRQQRPSPCRPTSWNGSATQPRSPFFGARTPWSFFGTSSSGRSGRLSRVPHGPAFHVAQ